MFIRLHALRWVLTALFGLLPCCSAIADDVEQVDEPDVEYRVAQVAAGSGGVYTYKAGEWGLLRLILTNNQDVPVELECTTYFDVEPTLQYGRRIWMPAGTKVATSHPVMLPPLADPESGRVPFHTQVVVVGAAGREVVHDSSGKIQFSSELQVQTQSVVSGIISRSPDDEERRTEFSPNDLIVTGRMEIQLPRRVAAYGDRVLPSTAIGFETLDQLVVADDRFLRDAAATSAIRHWLHNGGRLWVMLDRVDPEILNSILGDESGCQVVDTVTLNQFTISSARDQGGFPDIVEEFENPVKLVRVIVNDEEVPILVNGWPAAFQKTCGAGRLLVTTLESDAWLTRKSGSELSRIQRSEDFWPYSATPALQHLMSYFFQERVDDAPLAENFEPKLHEFVGYSIPGKGIVFGFLGGFVGLLAAGGLWLLKSGKLERLAWVTPAITIVSAGALILIGQQHRQAVPPSTAVLQVVKAIPGTDSVFVSGAAALYSPDSRTSDLSGEAGGWISPELDGTDGTIRRLMWTDSDQWEWKDLPQPPGLRAAEMQVSLNMPERLSAKAVFGPEGLTGTLSTPDGMLPVDAIIASRTGRMAVDLQPDGGFAALNTQVLGADEYLRTGLLNDDQARRSRILSELLQQPSHGLIEDPHLMFWTAPWDAGLRINEDTTASGMALVVVPIELERPPAATEVSLSAPLIPYREASGPDGFQPSGLFDARKRVWVPKARPATCWLSFELPEDLMPIDIKTARLEIRVTGPMGKIELAMARDGEVVHLNTWMDPVGTLTYELDGAELPGPESADSLLLRITVGDPDRPELTAPDPETGKLSYWRIESLTLEVDAIVLPRELPAESP